MDQDVWNGYIWSELDENYTVLHTAGSTGSIGSLQSYMKEGGVILLFRITEISIEGTKKVQRISISLVSSWKSLHGVLYKLSSHFLVIPIFSPGNFPFYL